MSVVVFFQMCTCEDALLNLYLYIQHFNAIFMGSQKSIYTMRETYEENPQNLINIFLFVEKLILNELRVEYDKADNNGAPIFATRKLGRLNENKFLFQSMVVLQ